MFNNYSGVAPKVMSLESIKEFTNNFSKEGELGRGTYGKVYKGVQDGEEVAVKMLHLTQGHDDREQFMRELGNLWRLKHHNIVQLLGYCYEIKREFVDSGNGRYVFADNIYRVLCFEYMHNGSLRKHLYDESHGLDWQTRYKIIKGTCEGLKYLHEGLESPMYHLDLKPENILLDKDMVPKLADFGLSKLVDSTQTNATQSSIGTMGYLPPEYIEENLVSSKLDIFSLGVVMIRIIIGYEGYHKKAEMSSQGFTDLVHGNWRNRLQATSHCTSVEGECRQVMKCIECTSMEAQCHQVKKCIEIALDCVHADRKKRPTIGEIIDVLNKTEHGTVKSMEIRWHLELRNGPLFSSKMQNGDDPRLYRDKEFLPGGAPGANTSSGAEFFDFDMRYAQWLEDDGRRIAMLQGALQANHWESDLSAIVADALDHHDKLFSLKAEVAQSDVLRIITGAWENPVQRLFQWMGGFRPSDLFKRVLPQLDPLTEQQLLGICNLQQSAEQAEEALSHCLEQLHRSLDETVESEPMNNGPNLSFMHQIAAVGKLSTIQSLFEQADNLRQQVLHQICKILTTRQAAKFFLGIGVYNNRYRALSSLWASQPRDKHNTAPNPASYPSKKGQINFVEYI